MITLLKQAKHQEIIKKSRFVCRAVRTDTVDLAMRWIDELRDDNATHNAWAYTIGPVSRYNDDGEVSGTAGKPILSVVEREGIDHVTVMVTRYFGGIKLGAAGLIRAYGGAAAACLQLAEREEINPRFHFTMTVPFSRTNAMYLYLETCNFHHRTEFFEEKGLTFNLVLDQVNYAEFRVKILDITAGDAVFTVQSG